jgi:plastocyanin
VLVIHGSQTSSEFTGYFKSNNIKNSTDSMIISIDRPSYKQGQTINFIGKVYHYNEASRVNIKITDPSKNTVADFNSFLNRFGIFTGAFDIPTSYPDGKYIIDAKYQGDSKAKPISLKMTISNFTKEMAYIYIPYGAYSESSKMNFAPSTLDVQQGTIISWKNNDITTHTIISGKINADGTSSLDNLLKNTYLGSGNEIQISPAPGKYNYFCKLHPWLDGIIIVEKNPPTTSKITSKTESKTILISKTGSKTILTSKSFPISNSTMHTIWKERKDLQKLYPEVARGDLMYMSKWATSTGWNQDKRLAALIPPGKVPVYLDSVLQSIWKERKDLQKLYPEVAKGNLSNMTKWATSTGWTQYDSLSALVPQTKIQKNA